MTETVERKQIPERAAQILMAAHDVHQRAQERLGVVMESIRATLDVPLTWQAKQEPDGTVWFVPPAQPAPTE